MAAKKPTAGGASAGGACFDVGMDDSVMELGRGSRVWYRQDPTTWVLAEMKDGPQKAPEPERPKKGAPPPAAIASITLLSGDSAGKPVDGVPVTALMPANPEMQATIPDLTQLSYLNEPSILGNLNMRYAKDMIYTCAGPVLIALNPCKELPLYTEEVQHEYKTVAHESLHNLNPHVYLVAGAAYRAMVREGASQSIVINGESGAGKTETTKRAMKFLANLAGGPGRVEERVLETNPVLEAFGNAKTLRNHNSSRFGKLVEIHFNQTHHICGARIRTYLLEKSRVVHQLQGERSYHIFYQLVKGVDKKQRERLRLPGKPEDFKYLAQSGCLSIQGVDDAKDFGEVTRAMADVGISPEQQEVLWALLSGVLWLGNLKVDAVTDDSSKVQRDKALDNAAAMLGVSMEALAHALTHKKIRTRDELIVKPLNKLEAMDAVDALAKAIYAGVFRWVVQRINESLDTGRRGSGQFIAILDIYGFECFNTNSFEQLCINYANEALQQQFTQHLFTLEQEEYMSEGIDWTKVEWTDNSACLDAIDALPPKGLGVLAVLDSQCKFPKASDDTFVTALRDALATNAIFSTDPRHPDQFLLRHYAGHVAYSAAGFLEKNKDTLSPDLIEVMRASTSWLLTEIGTVAADESEGRRGGGTVSSRFSSQLKELLQMLDVTGLHFVRCIKPNAALVPASFAHDLVLSQLRCCGVLEVARVSRAGFPTRYPHAAFVDRYRVMLPKSQQAEIDTKGGRGVREAVSALLAAFDVKPGQYEIGHTKVFFRPGVLANIEDRWARLHEASLRLQAFWRMWKLRSAFKAARKAAITLQTDWRGRAQRLPFNQRVKEHRAAIMVQRNWRGYKARRDFKRARDAVVTIQMAERRRKLRQRVAVRVAEREAREAAERAEAEEARRREEGFEVLKKQYNVTTLDDVKSALACWGALRDEVGARDPDEVRAALAVYGAYSRFEAAAGRSAVAAGSEDEAARIAELKSGLALAAAARKAGAKDAAAITASMDLAAAARVVMGESEATPAKVTAALKEHHAAAAALGQNARLLSDPQGLADAVAARGEMRAVGVAGAAALAGVVAVARAAGASATPEQVASAMAVQRAAGEAGPEQVSSALALQKAAVGAGLPDAEQLATAGALRKAAGGANADVVAAALKLQHAAAAAGLESPEQVSEAAALARAAGDSSPEQVTGALALQEAAVVAGLGTMAQLSNAAAVQKKVGARSADEVASALALLEVAGEAAPEDVAAALALRGAAEEAGLASAEAIAAAAALKGAAGQAAPEDVAAAIALRSAAEDAGLASAEALAAAAALKAAAGKAAPEDVAAALSFQSSAANAKLASTEELAAAAALRAAAGEAAPEDVVAAIALRSAAEDAGLASAEALAAAAALVAAASSAAPEDVAAAIALRSAAKDAGLASAEALSAAAALKAAAGSAAPEDVAAALAFQSSAASVKLASAEELAAASALKAAAGKAAPEDIAAAIALRSAAEEAGLASAEALAAAAALKAAAGKAAPEDVAAALSFQSSAANAKLASAEELAAAAALAAAAGGRAPEDVAAALKLQDAAESAGLASAEALAAAAALQAAAGGISPDEVTAAIQLRAAAGNAGPKEVAEALALKESASGASLATPALLAGAAALVAAAGTRKPEDVAGALALQEAAAAAGLGSAEKLSAAAALAAAAGSSSPEDVAAALKLRSAAASAQLADAKQLDAAAALIAAAAGSSPSDVAAALKLRADIAAAGAPTESAELLSTLSTAGAAKAAGFADSGEAAAAAAALAACRGAGITDPHEIAVALGSWSSVRQHLAAAGADGAPHDTSRRVRRALGMYGIATSHGCGEKRDFVGAISLYGVLKDEHLTEEVELRAAAALYGAVREEGLAPDELQAAVATWAALRDEAGESVAPEEARDALRSHMARQRGGSGGGKALLTAEAGSSGDGAAANGDGAGGTVSSEEATALRQQLQVERAARQRYASQLEQQAIEWMEQVRLLKEHIDTLRARMPPSGAPGAPPTPPAPRSSGDTAANAAVSSLAADFVGKAPLFEDDADFIAEVARGASFAPGMDPQSELDLLRKKYDVWNKAFKERLRSAQTALRAANARRPGAIDLSSMPDLASPGLLGEDADPGSARSGDSWDGPGAAGGAAGAKKKKGIFGLR